MVQAVVAQLRSEVALVTTVVAAADGGMHRTLHFFVVLVAVVLEKLVVRRVDAVVILSKIP